MATHSARRGALVGALRRAPRNWNRVVAHRGWLAVRDRALAGLARRPALVVVLGDSGTGKTVLLKELTRVLRAGGIPAHLVPADLAASAWEDADPKSVLLIDAAGRLGEDDFRRLTEDGQRLVVLAERSGFASRLGELGASPTLLRLSPLEAREVGGFLAASLEPGHRSGGLFSEAAAAALAARSGGVPRVLHDLAGAALFLADREQAERVEPRHVNQAAAVGEGAVAITPAPPTPTPTPTPAPLPLAIAPLPPVVDAPTVKGRGYVLPLLAVVGLVGLGIGVAMRPRPEPPRLEPPSLEPPAAPIVAQSPAPPVVRPQPPSPPITAEAPPPIIAEAPTPAAPPIIVAAPAEPPPIIVAASPPPPTVVAMARDLPPDLPPVLPAGAFTTVAIRFAVGSPRAAQLAAALASGLREDGFAVDEPVAAPIRETSGARYVFAEDRNAADAVAQAAHRRAGDMAAVAVRRKPGEREPPPRPGAIQVVISGDGK